MITKSLPCGLQTLVLPSLNDEKKEFIDLVFYVKTVLPEESDSKENKIEKDLKLTFAPSHLIEHIIATQNKFYKLPKFKNNILFENAETTKFYTRYILKINKNYIKDTLPLVIDSIFKIKLNEDIRKHEQTIINHEFFTPKYDLENNNDKEDTLNIEISNQEIQKIIKKNFNSETINKYYKKNYNPENSIITLMNADKNTIDEFYETLNNYYKDYPVKQPTHYNINFEQEINGDKDTFDLIFSAKYNNIELKNKDSDRCRFDFIFKYPNNPKYNILVQFYQYIIINSSFESTKNNFINAIRTKRELAYAILSDIEDFNSEKKVALSISINTSNQTTHKLMTGVRNIINKVAYNNAVSPLRFKEQYKKFKEDIIRATYYNPEFSHIIPTINVIQLIAGKDNKTINIMRTIKTLNSVRYEDFMNFAKYLAQTEAYTILIDGNNIRLRDLRAFELKNKIPYSMKDTRKYLGQEEILEQLLYFKTKYEAENEEQQPQTKEPQPQEEEQQQQQEL